MTTTVNAAGGIGFILSICTAGMLGASMAAAHWRSPQLSNEELYLPFVIVTSGLFHNCHRGGCIDIGWNAEAGVTILTTRAVLLLACFLIAIGLIIGTAALCGKGDITSKGALDIVAGIIILAGCGAYTGMSIGIDNYQGENLAPSDFDWGFYICWASAAVSIIAGAFEVNGKEKPEQQGQIHPANIQQQMIWATNTQQSNGAVVQRQSQQLPAQHHVIRLQ